jgi:hypothetical protein
MEGSSCGLFYNCILDFAVGVASRNMKRLAQDSRVPDRDFNPIPPTYVAEVLRLNAMFDTGNLYLNKFLNNNVFPYNLMHYKYALFPIVGATRSKRVLFLPLEH